MPNASPTRWSLAACFCLLLAAPAAAQQGSEEISVRLVAVKGSGELTEGAKPEIPAALQRWGEVLTQLGMAHYEALGKQVQRAGPGTLLEFPLPLGHRAQVRVTRVEDRLQVSLEIQRSTEQGDKRVWKQVLRSEVRVADGGLYAVRCEKMFKGAHLLLLVTASHERLD